MSVQMNIEPRPVPLILDQTGRWRMSGSRISLERIVECYWEGMSPEGIVANFDTLRLADVYAVISYYLDHREEVDEYVRFCEARAQEVEQKIRAAFPIRPGLKEELQTRWAQREKQNAQSGQR